MKPMPAYRIEARRPILSPNHPQRKEPITVPAIPESATQAAGKDPFGFNGDFNPYSKVMPGITKASAVGFIISIITAIAIASSRPICAALRGTSSRALILIFDVILVFFIAIVLGYKPYKLANKPTMIAAMPNIIGMSMGIPTSL